MNAPARKPIFTRDFLLASGVNFCAATVFYGFVTTMAVYAWTRFDASDAEAGLAASMFVVGATIARLLAGKIIDWLGMRTVLLAFGALAMLATAGYFVPAGLTYLLALRLVHGIGFGFLSTVTVSIAQNMIPAERRAEGTGYFALTSALATGVGPVIGAAAVGYWDYRGLFITMFAISMVMFGFVLLLARAPLQKGSGQRLKLGLSGWIDTRVLPMAGYMMVLGIVYSGIITYVDAHGNQTVGPGTAGVFFFAYSVALISSRFIVGRMQDVRGDNIVIYPTIVCFAVSLFLVAVLDSVWLTVVAGALAGIGFGTVMSGMQAIAVAAVPQHGIPTAISTFYFMLDLGVGLGPLVLGVLVTTVGFPTMFTILAAGTLLSVVPYHLLHGRTKLAQRHRHRPV